MSAKQNRGLFYTVFAIIFVLGLSACSSSNASLVSISSVGISGDIGSEPVVSIPDNLQPADESYAKLREGNGEAITGQDDVAFRIQKIGLSPGYDRSRVYSSWNNADAPEIAIFLTDTFKEQIPAELREILLHSKIGVVVAFHTRAPASELDDMVDSALSHEGISAAFSNTNDPNSLVSKDDNQDDNSDIEQIWVITVVKRTVSE